MAEISLEDAIKDLRTQLQNAAAKGEDAAIRFVAKSVEVELSIVINREAEVKAGAKLWSIFDFSGSVKGGDENTHKVKLTLEPVDKNRQAALIGSTRLEETGKRGKK
jgi:Trypsin-co-occurring domain 2